MRPIALVLLLAACKPPRTSADDTPVTVRIVAMNDFHGGLYEMPVKGVEGVAGGLPWLHGALSALREEDPDLILLDGGDLFQGSWPVNATQGRGSVEAFNLLGVDAAAIGNHEFDYGGVEGGDPLHGALERAATQADYAWLSANIRQADGSRWQPEGVAPWTMLERKGKRIAVIGLTTMDTPTTTLGANVADLQFVDVVAAVNEILPEVQAAKPDATLLVGHLTGNCAPPSYFDPGEPCLPSEEIGRLLTELPPGTFDVMVLGHAHTLLAQRSGDTFVLEDRASGHALGRVDLVIGPDGVDADASTLLAPWPLVHAPVDPGCEPGEYDLTPRDLGGRMVTPSAEALALVKGLEAEAGSLCTVVGCNARTLTRTRTAESDLGDFVSDAIAWSMPEADFAIQNSGGLRADLPAGTLRRADLQEVMPFDNRILLVELTGEQVKTLFRLGSSGAHGVLQVSAGASYHFDPSDTTGSDVDGNATIETWETDRLCAVTIGGKPLDPTATYKVAITDFLYGGGDHFGPAFAGVPIAKEGPLLRETLFDYPASLGTACIGDPKPVIDAARPRVVQGPCGP